jgi:sterol desaturase/sphingolipid hydroxylase (fatty acid hydroxylase superfamily)
LINFIEYGTRNKDKINNDISKIPIEDYKYEFHVNILTTTFVESISHLFIKTQIININISRSLYYEVIYFIPISFFFEIIFDFFHYFTHRILHHKYFYKFLHKKHHKFQHPSSITTFYQDPLDLLITNTFPTVMSLLIYPYVSYSQFNIIVVYKNFIEISGHSGKISYPTSSFSQFIWLPKFLKIELYTEDHDLHHSSNNCNYSKRFSLWDKVFNTYKSNNSR